MRGSTAARALRLAAWRSPQRWLPRRAPASLGQRAFSDKTDADSETPSPLMQSTTAFIMGHRIVRHAGLCQGSTVRTKHVGNDIFAAVRQIFGGELTAYTALVLAMLYMYYATYMPSYALQYSLSATTELPATGFLVWSAVLGARLAPNTSCSCAAGRGQSGGHQEDAGGRL